MSFSMICLKDFSLLLLQVWQPGSLVRTRSTEGDIKASLGLRRVVVGSITALAKLGLTFSNIIRYIFCINILKCMFCCRHEVRSALSIRTLLCQ